MPFYKGSAINQDIFECACGYRVATQSGDEEKAKKRIDLLIRLHKKVCKTHTTTTEKTFVMKKNNPLWVYGVEGGKETSISFKTEREGGGDTFITKETTTTKTDRN